jgi:hypothetical protein
VKLFGMNTEFPLQKQIGTKTKSVGGERIEMFLDTFGIVVATVTAAVSIN